jgi:hypothetical protein
VLRRYELLRKLHAEGINDHGAFRLREAGRARYPVFLRRARLQDSIVSPLIRSQGELLHAVRAASRRGHPLHDLIVVEFCDTGDEDGVYGKYGACLVGDRVVPKMIDFDTQWVVKSPGLDEPTEAHLQAEVEYLETNPHAEWIRDVFRLAKTDFGRIDYSIQDGVPRVWEINTNPDLVFPPRQAPSRARIKGMFDEMFFAALREIDLVAVDRPRLARRALPVTPHPRLSRPRLVSLRIATRDLRKRLTRRVNRWPGNLGWLILAARWRIGR